MELHEHLAELVTSVGPQVLDDPDGFRAALDDYLDEGAASTGDINLLVDTVRLGAYAWMLNTIASGGEGARAVEAAGTILARDRGSRDVDSARWACAVLAFAVGKVGDADVRRYRTRSLSDLPEPGPATEPASGPVTPVVAADASTEPVQPPAPMPPPPSPAPTPPPSPVTVHGDPPADVASPIGPHTPHTAQTQPPKRRGWVPVLAVLVVLAVVGGGFAAWRVLGDDDNGTPGGAASEQSSEPTDSSTAPSDPTTDVPVEERPDYVPVPQDPEPLPFDIDAELVNQPCTGEVVIMLATASVPANYADKLGQAIQGVPDAAVLRASDSCDAFQETNPETGAPIYNAYLGPFPTAADACEVLGTLDSPSAWVRELANPSQERELCFCEESIDGLPVIGPESDLDSIVTRRLIGQVQWALYLDGHLPKDAVFQTLGQYEPEFTGALTAFQGEVLVEQNGSVTRETWERLRDEFCDTDYYDIER